MKNLFKISITVVLLVTSSLAEVDKNCIVKGNISYHQGKKLYFTSTHPDYPYVRINKPGERCFKTEQEAKQAGWRKAPKSSYHQR